MEEDKINKLNEQIELLTNELENVKKELDELKSEKTFNPLKLLKNKKGIKEKEDSIKELSEAIKKKVESKKREIEKIKHKEERIQKYKDKANDIKSFVKGKSKIFAIVIVSLLIIISGFVGINIYNSNVHNIEFYSKEDDVLIGDKLNLEFEITPKNLNFQPEIEFKFSDLLFDKTDSNEYFANKEGKLLVSLYYKNEYYDQKTINIQPIELENYIVKDFDLVLNNECEIKPEIVPKNATYSEYQLSSSDREIVKIDGNKLIGIGEGKSLITIKSNNGKVKNTFNVDVKRVEADTIEISNIVDELILGESIDLKVKLSPEILSNYDYRITSSNSDVIKIENNRIEAINVGKVVITAVYSDDLYSEYEINVKYPPVNDVTITNIPKNDIYINESYQLGIEYKPEKASDNEFEWISSNEDVLKISSNGLITGVSVGVAEITLRSINGIEDHTNIRVLEKSSTITRNIPTESSSSSSTGNSTDDSTVTRSNTSGSGSSSKMVWLSATGDCYHAINNCGRMNPNKAKQVTEEYAINHGYSACSKCNP